MWFIRFRKRDGDSIQDLLDIYIEYIYTEYINLFYTCSSENNKKIEKKINFNEIYF